MSKTPEAKVKDAIKEYLDTLELCWYFMPSMTGYGRKGIPDIIGCNKGEFFAIEVKAPGKENTVTPWQERELISIFDAGGLSFVASDVSFVKMRIF